jgi:hypothetical protein
MLDSRELDQKNSLNSKEIEAIKHEIMSDHISKRNAAGSVPVSLSLP